MDINRDCTEARSLIPAYQDGELAEERAAPLRRHLLGCHACREVAKAATALERWFEPGPEVEVPAGFAAHVARRAFAGAQPEPEAPTFGRPSAVDSAVRSAPGEGRLLSFVLGLTAAAAVALIALSVALRRESLPSSGELEATTITETIEYLEALERAEMWAADEAPAEVPAENGAAAER